MIRACQFLPIYLDPLILARRYLLVDLVDRFQTVGYNPLVQVYLFSMVPDSQFIMTFYISMGEHWSAQYIKYNLN